MTPAAQEGPQWTLLLSDINHLWFFVFWNNFMQIYIKVRLRSTLP